MNRAVGWLKPEAPLLKRRYDPIPAGIIASFAGAPLSGEATRDAQMSSRRRQTLIARAYSIKTR